MNGGRGWEQRRLYNKQLKAKELRITLKQVETNATNVGKTAQNKQSRGKCGEKNQKSAMDSSKIDSGGWLKLDRHQPGPAT